MSKGNWRERVNARIAEINAARRAAELEPLRRAYREAMRDSGGRTLPGTMVPAPPRARRVGPRWTASTARSSAADPITHENLAGRVVRSAHDLRKPKA